MAGGDMKASVSRKFYVIAGATFLAAALTPVAPVAADTITASCATIAGVSSSEADYLYYEAEAEIGAASASRLYGVYHQLKNKCQHNSSAKIAVSVQPRVKAFFEARR